MIKALITGITGMVGSHLADFLIKETNWDIYGVCRWRSPLDNVEHLLDRVNKKERLFFDYADLSDEVSLIKIIRQIKPDYIFHLAAQSYPLTSFNAPIDTLNINILGTCRLLEAVRLETEQDNSYSPVIHIFASSEVFGKIPAEIDGANLTENADRLVFSTIYQDWLIKCLEAPFIQSQIADVTTKVGQPKLAIKRIQELLFPLPPLAEQKRIVAKLEELLPLCERLK